jgi:hypothetical protein
VVIGRLVTLEIPETAESYLQAIRAAGGLWAPAGLGIKLRELIWEAKERGVRALQLPATDELLVRELPDLEFLFVTGPPADARWINMLANLRLLYLESQCIGRLDLSALRRLEWLSLRECDQASMGALAVAHPTLHDLDVVGCPARDFAPFAALRLRRLSLVDCRRLESLAGVEALAPTLTALELSLCPSLGSLDGIEAIPNLEVLELYGIRHITRLDWVERLPRLRMLDISDLKNVESLAPLAGHPSLEFVTFGLTKDLDLEPLTAIPNLKLVHTGGHRWNRDPHDFPQLFDLPADHPKVLEYYALKHG